MVVQMNTEGVWKVLARFPNALGVYILGEFNNWSTTATPLRAMGQGDWEGNLPGRSEEAQVCFFVWERGQRFGHVMAHDVEGEIPLTSESDLYVG